MLAGIIQTIIMALGIATGNISSNAYKGGNVFNDVEQSQKAPIKRATENYQIIVNGVHVAQTYTNSNVPNSGDVIYAEKQYLGNDNVTANNYTDQLIIRNSLYSYTVYNANNTQSYYWMLMQITPYYGAHQDTMYIDVDISYSPYTATQTQRTIFVSKNFFTTETDISQWIDITANASIDQQMGALNQAVVKQNQNSAADYFTLDATMTTPMNVGFYNYVNDIQEGQTTTVCMYFAITDSAKYIYTSRLDSMTVDGRVTSTPINYEVIDLPGIMYTVLTMPFSFISTAFNLTVFPGTPYALNFGNLFLTILAIFILLWLIKKVFH